MSQVGQRERLSAELDSPAAAKFRAPVMGVEVNECRIKRMRTLWGSCHIQAKRKQWDGLHPPHIYEIGRVESIPLLTPSLSARFKKKPHSKDAAFLRLPAYRYQT